jgi:hypothetical protein
MSFPIVIEDAHGHKNRHTGTLLPCFADSILRPVDCHITHGETHMRFSIVIEDAHGHY